MLRNLRRLITIGLSVILLLLVHCGLPEHRVRPGARGAAGPSLGAGPSADNPYPTIGAIPPPPDYHRMTDTTGSFAGWLRTVPLKKDRTVFLYDGTPKNNQDAQFAVLDVSVGHQDLQQCADAVMRLRAEYLRTVQKPAAIDFVTEQGVRLNYREWENGGRVRLSGNRLVAYALPGQDLFCNTRACFDQYLHMVFMYCGTRTLERQLVSKSFTAMAPGDVLIRGGSPGHAMLVVDMAEDVAGRRVYLLAQSYMPAQDIHIVKNPAEGGLSPWYRLSAGDGVIQTPEWTFTINQLRTWPSGSGAR